MEAPIISYDRFVRFAVEQAKLHTTLSPVTSLDKFRNLKSKDEKTLVGTVSYEAPKIRLLRGLSIDGGPAGVKVLDLAVFAKPEFDLPIFCANFFSTPRINIVVLDLNPLHSSAIQQRDCKDKYYNHLLPLAHKYSKVLPWGEKITSESLQFFSPIVIWTKFASSVSKHEVLYSAFVDYFEAWLMLMDEAIEDKDPAKILQNRDAQHRYLTWRAQKDPGRPILESLVGEHTAEDVVRNFLFYGVDCMRQHRTFLDYFPEYESEDGSVSKKRSIVGKSFETRPWDQNGDFIAQ